MATINSSSERLATTGDTGGSIRSDSGANDAEEEGYINKKDI